MTILQFDNEDEWLEARKKNINSTDLAALFGLSQWRSRLQLWNIKAGYEEEGFVETPFTDWGRYLQGPVGVKLCRDNGWAGADLTGRYMVDESLRLGASMDVLAHSEKGRGLLEIKVVENMTEESGWTKTKAPIEYEFQIQGQLHLAKRNDPSITWGAIGALGRRQRSVLLPRAYDPELGELIDKEVKSFWASIEANEPPAPDYYLDQDLLHRLRGPLLPGDIVNLTSDQEAVELLGQIVDLKAQRKPLIDQADKLKKEIDAKQARFHDIMGVNEIAVVGRLRVKAKIQKREAYVNYGGSESRRFDISKS